MKITGKVKRLRPGLCHPLQATPERRLYSSLTGGPGIDITAFHIVAGFIHHRVKILSLLADEFLERTSRIVIGHLTVSKGRVFRLLGGFLQYDEESNGFYVLVRKWASTHYLLLHIYCCERGGGLAVSDSPHLTQFWWAVWKLSARIRQPSKPTVQPYESCHLRQFGCRGKASDLIPFSIEDFEHHQQRLLDQSLLKVTLASRCC